MRARVPILMYHEVTPAPLPPFRKYSVTPAELDAQLAWLRAEGYTSVDLDTVRAAWRGEGTLPPRAVAITFDDGLRDCVEHAVPALVRHGFTATFFVVAGLVGATSRWLLAERGFELPMATWSALRAATSAGMRCEAHSMTHPRLATLDASACRDELARGRAVLEDALGQPVRHLAYPFGSYSAAVRDLARDAGYYSACTVREGLATPADDLLALPRVPVLGTEGMDEFARRVRTGASIGGVRRLVHRVARRLGMAPGRERPS
jgi:peptidoglycan/xylan/chitin deacetylase (PgdA/CDA1 family)